MSKRTLAILGFPEAGKTTFIASFYATIQENGDSYFLKAFPPESSYLDEILRNLEERRCNSHTPSTVFEEIVLELEHDATNEHISLVCPDLSGEEFDAIWELRILSDKLETLWKEAQGVLVFLSRNVHPTARIYDIQKLAGTLNQEQTDDTNKPYELHESPIAVKLVEILQQLLNVNPTEQKLRISILISAWDMELALGNGARTPEVWLREELPLLFQYLACQEAKLAFTVFGVSAQGVNFEAKIPKDTLKLTPAKRAFVCRGDTNDKIHDVRIPVIWASET